jgi:hypothetical protein
MPNSTLESSPPPTLWHYTSPGGLAGIITGGEVWATVIHYLNDAKEFQHALELFRTALAGKIAQTSDPGIKTFLSFVKDSLDRVMKVNVCVFSLSEDGNLLSQWRAYCPPEGGYSIGFRTSQLTTCLQQQGFRLIRCIYDETVQRQFVEETLNEFVTKYSEKHGGQPCSKEIFNLEFSGLVSQRIWSVAPTFKHPSFSEEQEWRAVSQPIPWTNDAISYRVGASCIIPHYKLGLQDASESSVISHIMVGPSKHPELASASINFLRNRAKMKIQAVAPSHTPYRTL